LFLCEILLQALSDSSSVAWALIPMHPEHELPELSLAVMLNLSVTGYAGGRQVLD